jgi:hypothetical protein
MVNSTVSLQALGGTPKKWEREISHRPARCKGKRIVEKRCRRSARQEIESQLEVMSVADLRIERDAARVKAQDALDNILTAYHDTVSKARKARDAAIEALPLELRQFIHEYMDEDWPVRKFYAE